MTIAAGFRCIDGVLLCADSQYMGWEKSQGDKIFSKLVSASTSVAFSISGDVDYAKTAVEDSFDAVLSLPLEKLTFKEVKRAIRGAIKNILNEYDLPSIISSSHN